MSSDTRERIVAAAAAVMREQGVGGATTKQIARRAGVAEGSIYNHFTDKLDLLGAVILDEIHLREEVATLREPQGDRDLTDVVQRLVMGCLEALPDVLELSAYALAEPQLRAEFAERLQSKEAGPVGAQVALSDYLRVLQETGEVRADADPETAATMCLGACYFHAYDELVRSAPAARGRRIRQAQAITAMLVDYLTPR